MLKVNDNQRQTGKRWQAKTGGKMRLICPNCGAQYEVPTEVIPESGRDVQCSDCSNTWFQHHPDYPPAEDVQEALQEDDAPRPDLEDASATPDMEPAEDYGVDHVDDRHEPEPTPEPEPEPEPEPLVEAQTEPDQQPTIQRRTLDADVADVLREEAERESRARDQELRGTIETQTELGLDDANDAAHKRSEEARARMARLRGMPETDPGSDVDAAHDDIDPSSRRNLLPDIEEINSSLTPEADRDEPTLPPPAVDPLVAPRPRSGFRSGFRLAVILAVAALMLYVFAPQLSNAVPALAGPLTAFVDIVNSGRLALSEMMQNLAASLSEGGATDS